jgi:sugar lactone lactonase YvrE
MFFNPSGISNDGAGNLFVSANDAIRKVVIATGTVSTVAGVSGMFANVDGVGTAARLNGAGIAFDGTSNFYIADFNNQTIRKLVASTGALSTLAGAAGMPGTTDGTGANARFNFPDGIAFDSGNLYVADESDNTIRKVVISTGAVTTFAGGVGISDSVDAVGTAARFGLPIGITSDGAGNLYVVDLVNSTIRKIVIATAAVSTIAGAPTLSGATDGVG